MLRVLAIDDEPLALRQIVAYINKLPELQLVAECRSALEAREVLSREPVDAIFCDINMPDLNGMDFVRQLTDNDVVQRRPQFIFTTAYSEYAVEGFKVDAVDYLLKPFSFADFTRAVERLRQRQEQSTIFVRADHRNIAIQLCDIIRVLAMGEYLRLYVAGQTRTIMTLMSMKRIQELLPSRLFLRIHRSHIINLQHVAEVGKSVVVLDDGTQLPVGENHRATLEQWVAEHSLKTSN